MGNFRKYVTVTSAAALVLLSTALVGSASAASPGCGAIITQSVTLQADVGPCNTTDGLVVQGSGLTLNLNGHRVFSTAPLPRTDGFGNPFDVVGIHLINVHNVIVTGGSTSPALSGRGATVSGFEAGVVIEGGGTNTVRNLVAKDNRGPCLNENFTTQVPANFGDGIAMFSSINNQIQNNRVDNNGPYDGIGVVANTFLANQPVPDQPLPTGNQITGNNVNESNYCSAEMGVRIEGPGASKNTVKGNTIDLSDSEGIGVLAVNNINFAGAFSNPATCQNRNFPTSGVPSATLTGNFVKTGPNTATVTLTSGTFPAGSNGAELFNPSAPIFAPGTVNIATVTSPTTATLTGPITASTNGVTFSLLPLCPLLPNQPANNTNVISNNKVTRNGFNQTGAGRGTRGGIVLLSFCGYGTLNGNDNTIENNNSQFNAGNGIGVGGCSPTNVNPVGWTYNHILSNTSLNNNQNAGGRFDLFDGNANCDNNIWLNNTYRTASPPCTTVGGTIVTTPPTPMPPLPPPPPGPYAPAHRAGVASHAGASAGFPRARYGG